MLKYIYTKDLQVNGGDHSLGDIIVGRFGWGDPNGRGGIELRGDLDLRHDIDTRDSDIDINGDLTVNNSIRSKTDHIKLRADSVRAHGELARFEGNYLIAQQ